MNKIPIEKILAIIVGGMCFHMGRRIFYVLDLATPFGNINNVLVIWFFYLIGFLLIYISLTETDLLEKWNRHIAYFLLFSFAVSVILFFDKSRGLGTDAVIFSRYSAQLVLEGINPYAESMREAFNQFKHSEGFITHNIDGSVVTNLSYPALSVLFFLPQVFLGIQNINITTLIFFITVLGFLIHQSPKEIALIPLLILFLNPNLLFYSAGGVFDILWVLPVLFGMMFFYQKKYLYSMALLGLAFSVKQTAWFLAPFIAIYLWKEEKNPSLILKSAGVGFTAFITPNLPFLLDAPKSWIHSVIAPMSPTDSSIVIQGDGLALLDYGSILSIDKTYFLVALLFVFVIHILFYYIYFEDIKHTFWIVPASILWFNYRSLQNYFIFFIPIAYYVLLNKYDLVRSELKWKLKKG